MPFIADLTNMIRRWLGYPTVHVYEEPIHNLLRVDRPDSSFVAELEVLLRQMQVVPADTIERIVRTATVPVVCGDLSTVMATLVEVLRDNVQRTTEFVETELAICFEYVVRTGYQDPAGLDVLTRLYHPDKKDAACYGRTVYRKSDTEYVLVGSEC